MADLPIPNDLRNFQVSAYEEFNKLSWKCRLLATLTIWLQRFLAVLKSAQSSSLRVRLYRLNARSRLDIAALTSLVIQGAGGRLSFTDRSGAWTSYSCNIAEQKREIFTLTVDASYTAVQSNLDASCSSFSVLIFLKFLNRTICGFCLGSLIL